MGRVGSPTLSSSSVVDGSCDSHVIGGMEYIVPDPAQILPCYVIHLDWGAESARRLLEGRPDNPLLFVQYNRKRQVHPKLEADQSFPGDKLREKQDKQAAAAKWFPHGYGPAKGTSFVIEEFGEVSEDEENYGQYQGAKLDFGEEDYLKVQKEMWLQDKLAFDEYTSQKNMPHLGKWAKVSDEG